MKEEIIELQREAIRNENENKKSLERMGIDKMAQEIIADKQYWNGYLDALNNVKKIVNNGSSIKTK